MGENSRYLALMRQLRSRYAENDPPRNVAVTCDYCGGQFRTAIDSRSVNCLHCGAPVNLAKSSS